MTTFANVVLYLSLITAVLTVLLYAFGLYTKDDRMHRMAKWGVLITSGLIVLATVILLIFITSDQFKYSYIAGYSSADLAFVYKISVLWAGKAGSMLTWTAMLAILAMAFVLSRKIQEKNYTQYVLPIVMLNIVFFMILIVFVKDHNPFALYVEDGITVDPGRGAGLTPALQNFWMIMHPVTLFLGYTGLITPFAFAMAALMKKDTSDTWIVLARRWTLVAWVMLTLGNVMGGKWAYVELGWGGYWAWDPVENASLMPWFMVTAYLHSVMVQERKNMFKMWNVSLATMTYLLVIFGTYLVRSGVVSSVHAFGENSIGNAFLVFMGIIAIVALYLIISRAALFRRSSDTLESLFSKEASILYANVFFIIATVIIFYGTMSSKIFSLIGIERPLLNVDYYAPRMGAVLMAVMILMTFAPLLKWFRKGVKTKFDDFYLPIALGVTVATVLIIFGMRKPWAIIGFSTVGMIFAVYIQELILNTLARRKSTGETFPVAFVRISNKNRRRYGGYLVHIGIAIMMLGIVGSQNYKYEKVVTVSSGESILIQDYQISFEGITQKKDAERDVYNANMVVYKQGKKLQAIAPEFIFFNDVRDSHTSEVTVLSSFKEDLYIVLQEGFETNKATFMVEVNTLVTWIWIGTIVLCFGTLFAFWKPRNSDRKSTSKLVSNVDSDILSEIEAEIEAEIAKAKGKEI